MKILVESNAGYVKYDDLYKEMRAATVESLIEHSIIHLRPTSRCSFDLLLFSANTPIITAESACRLYAMKRFYCENKE